MKEKHKNIPDEQPVSKKKKKKGKAGFTLVILLLILVLGAGIAYYFYERSQPGKALETYLASIQKMDFTSMESQLQSNDLSALDNADIRNAAYQDFFSSINAKMTYKIVKTRFSFQDGTAEVTARIRYIDGTNIYKETITEFLRQIVSSAFSGENLTEEETQNKLASILTEKAASLEDTFTETDVTYPMIKVNGLWKVTSLDDETVKIMSANFKSVEDEISQTLNDPSDPSDTSGSSDPNAVDAVPPESTDNADSTEGSASAGQTSGSDGTIDLANDRFSIHYTRNVVATDFGGEPCLLVYYDYTNNGFSASSAMVDVNLTASQNGTSLEAAIPANSDDAIDAFMKEIQPGETINVCQAFSLQDMSPVTLRAADTFGLDNGATASQTLTLQ